MLNFIHYFELKVRPIQYDLYAVHKKGAKFPHKMIVKLTQKHLSDLTYILLNKKQFALTRFRSKTGFSTVERV